MINRSQASQRKFKSGDIVWGQAKDSPAWPAYIKMWLKDDLYEVNFFGENATQNEFLRRAVLKEEAIFDYARHSARFKNKRTSRVFLTAIKVADQKLQERQHKHERNDGRQLRPRIKKRKKKLQARECTITEKIRREEAQKEEKIKPLRDIRIKEIKKKIKNEREVAPRGRSRRKQSEEVEEEEYSEDYNQEDYEQQQEEVAEVQQQQQVDAPDVPEPAPQAQPMSIQQPPPPLQSPSKPIPEVIEPNPQQVQITRSNINLLKSFHNSLNTFLLRLDQQTPKIKLILLQNIIASLSNRSIKVEEICEMHINRLVATVLVRLEKRVSEGREEYLVGTDVLQRLRDEFEARKLELIELFTSVEGIGVRQ